MVHCELNTRHRHDSKFQLAILIFHGVLTDVVVIGGVMVGDVVADRVRVGVLV